MKSILISEQEFNEIQRKLDSITESILNASAKNQLVEKWLDNAQVCIILKVSSRTLQNYRDNGILPFSQIGNKIYYKAEDIDKHLESGYLKSSLWKK